ncbi:MULTISPECIES: hypothetical protein [Psychrilyobacter]|uniref:DUF945 domain-containing protein n=1 Tax=Psychrilyobacter piezotolerans TaxID=2293438 RepID=A0ABX9KEV2_9FUSO|nr:MULTISPECIES: hypothetical protein [Psychrilyobacter]MCS5420833.1 hypothetical protein [Psychrilyobacter sp. S5]NDI79123.1 hypothetical protein [Psychrilyobacter piezotolerans]RDE59765.1 hypothetical protein DV867_12140 [Psychrilyobacter sp. S5]REI40091.1 hypothetical protein DYH56_12140 [Psychrilyobacter piezotolerans]
MNKILKNITGAIVLLVILIVFYLLTFQLSHERLVVKESKAVISIGDLNSKKVNAYYELYEKTTQTDLEESKKWTKHIKGLDLIYYNDSNAENQKEDKEIIAINLGWRYPAAKFKQGEYFDDLGKNYFSLKEVYQKQLEENYDVDKKIYMTNYKGYYFISDDVMKLSDYMGLLVKKEINKNISSKMKGDTLGEAVIDLEGLAQGMDAVKINVDYEKNELSINSYLYGDLEFSKYLNGIEQKDRKFHNYMGKDKIYITNTDFKGLTTFIRGNINPEINSMLSMVKMFTGKDFEEYMDKVDGEIVYDYVKNQMILPVKETKDFKKLIEIFAKKDGDKYILGNGTTIEIKDNVIYYNGIMSEGSTTPKEDEFINISLNLGLYNPVLKDIYMDMGGKIEKNKINIRAAITDEELLEIYNRMEGEKND